VLTTFIYLIPRPKLRRLQRLEVASVTLPANAENDEDERNYVQHPTGMTAARYPKVGDCAIEVGAPDEQTCRELGAMFEPGCRRDQGKSADDPIERAELKESCQEPSTRSGHRDGKLLQRPDHPPLDDDAVSHRDTDSNDASSGQGYIVQIHDLTPRKSGGVIPRLER
jgi:hypothetical protein